MSSWKVFIDDSADERREKFVIAGALFGKKQDLYAFGKTWKKALRACPSISSFHGKELRTLSGEFRQFRDANRWPPPTGSAAANAKRDKLQEVIKCSQGVVALGVGVLVPDYQRVKASHRLGSTHMADDVFECALQHVIMQSIEAIKRIDRQPQVTFIYDRTNRENQYKKVYESFKSRNPDAALALNGFDQRYDQKIPALQASDMIASAVKDAFQQREVSNDAALDMPLLPAFYRIVVVNRDYIIAVLDSQSEMTDFVLSNAF